MKTMMMAGLGLCVLSAAALAEPQKMSEDQMGDVTAGFQTDGYVPGFSLWITSTETNVSTNEAAQVGEAAAVSLFALGGSVANVIQSIEQANVD